MSRDVPEGSGLLTPRLEAGRAALRLALPQRRTACRLRRARPAGPAAGLGQTDTERARTPSIGSARVLLAQDPRGTQRSLFTYVAWPPHPIARDEPGPPRQRMAGRFELSRVGACRPGRPERRAWREQDASHRLLQPTHEHEHPKDRLIPGAPSCVVTLAGPYARDAGALSAKGLGRAHGWSFA